MFKGNVRELGGTRKSEKIGIGCARWTKRIRNRVLVLTDRNWSSQPSVLRDPGSDCSNTSVNSGILCLCTAISPGHNSDEFAILHQWATAVSLQKKNQTLNPKVSQPCIYTFQINIKFGDKEQIFVRLTADYKYRGQILTSNSTKYQYRYSYVRHYLPERNIQWEWISTCEYNIKWLEF